MEKFNRAVRRHHINRLKKTRKNYWHYGVPHRQVVVRKWHAIGVIDYGLVSQRGVTEMPPSQLGGVVQHPQSCSCLMGCGNARAYYGRTLAELRWHAMADDQMQEV